MNEEQHTLGKICTLTLEERKKWFRRSEICESAMQLLVHHSIEEGLVDIIHIAEEAHDLLMIARQDLCNDLFTRDSSEDHSRGWR